MLLFLAGVKHLYIQQPVWTLTLLNVWTEPITYSVSFQWVHYQPPLTLWYRGENNKTTRPAQSKPISRTGMCKVKKRKAKEKLQRTSADAHLQQFDTSLTNIRYAAHPAACDGYQGGVCSCVALTRCGGHTIHSEGLWSPNTPRKWCTARSSPPGLSPPRQKETERRGGRGREREKN